MTGTAWMVLTACTLFLPTERAVVSSTQRQDRVRAADWPMFRGNARLTGVAEGTLPARLEVLWRFETDGSEPVTSSAAIARGLVFFGSEGGDFYALDLSDGTRRWRYSTGEAAIQSSPAVAGGLVFFGDENGVFHALEAATGKQRWSFTTGAEIISSANPVGDRVVFGSYDGNVYCLAARDGALRWRFETSAQVHATPAVADGRVFVAGCDGQLHIIGLDDGTETAALDVGARAAASPAVQGDRVFLGTLGNRVLCVDCGAQRLAWSFENPDRGFPFHASAAVLEKQVIVAGRDRTVYALDSASGKARWTFRTKGKVDSSPVIVRDRVFVGSADGRLYALDLASGRPRWRFEAGAPISASPAVAGGRLVIGANDGVVYCFGAKSTHNGEKESGRRPQPARPLEDRRFPGSQ
ncbi:MAG: PQQ-binding-like beta-propeller repeat protein [Phycisphaerae bacterium]